MRETLTTKENILARINNEQAVLYKPEKLLTINEQVKLDIFSSTNEYNKVGSTVDAPILNEQNVLYKFDGIDDDLLYEVLQLHSKSSRRTDLKKEEDSSRADAKDWEPFESFVTDFWYIKETRAHTSHGNIPMYTEDTQWFNNESLWDIIWHKQLAKSKVNAKLSKLQKDIMFNLDNLWKDYHKLSKEKDIATWERYMQISRPLKDTFNKIKWIEKLKDKLES